MEVCKENEWSICKVDSEDEVRDKIKIYRIFLDRFWIHLSNKKEHLVKKLTIKIKI